MSETDQEQIAKLQLALCLAVGPCPEVTRGIEFAGPEFLGSHPLSCICGGSSKLPLLEGVREECSVCLKWNDWERQHVKPPCPSCQGRGWVPSGNTFKYLEAYRELLAASKPSEYQLDDKVLAFTLYGELVTLEVLAKALGVKDSPKIDHYPKGQIGRGRPPAGIYD